MLEAFCFQGTDPKFQQMLAILHRNRDGPTQIMKHAKGGSVVAIELMTSICTQIHAMQTLEVVDILCSHVAASKIPHPFADPSPSDLSAVGCAFWSLSAINRLTLNPNIPIHNVERLKQQVITAWDGIQHWIAFFDELSPRLTKKEHRTVHNAIAHTIYLIVTARRDLLNTPGVLELAASIWSKEPRYIYRLPIEATENSSSLAWLILRDANDALIEQFVSAAGDLPARVARTALSHVHGVLKDPKSTTRVVIIHLRVLLHLMDGKSASFREAVIEQCGVSVVTRTIVALVDKRDHAVQRTREAVCLAFVNLRKLCRTGTVIRSVQSAVCEGLLHAYSAFFRVRRHYDAKEVEHISFFLSDILPLYMVYRSTVDAVVGARMSTLNMPTSVGNKFSDIWVNLEKQAHAYADLKARWDSVKRMECQNCHVHGDKADLRRCARCKSVFYCSGACQVTDWDGHKRSCLVRRQQHARNYYPTMADRNFLHLIAVHDSRHMIARIRSMAAEQHPSTSLSEIGICINYSNSTQIAPFPSIIDEYNVTDRLQSAPHDSEIREKEALKDVVDAACKEKHGTTLIECITWKGARAFISLFLVSPSIWDPLPENTTQLDFILAFRVVTSAMAVMASAE
ncbi:hypothetical protein FA95DRAFT_1556028 [Auriscalpium vulgare]|uniref:Uncharacterized protein n=1 Tax=Auriscalpium vulgare TaxID=40419 RepID=A0ACB8S1U9_9AGAM|nr:hypothetical protein FA95DRAFT_1556028 [Auriscalpium vulgare]